MTRADMKAAAAEKYPYPSDVVFDLFRLEAERAAYIQGRLDQIEEDARIAEALDFGPSGLFTLPGAHKWGAMQAAVAIRKGAE